MLNNKNERELAYVVRVDEIRELPGYDKVESARINGWWCIVPKGQFSVGSLGVYFEIDSLVDATNPAFAFMEKRNYRVKTQKMCKSISQGLLLAFSDFGWEDNKYKEGDFLTKELNIKYYEPADNQRKASSDPNAKYKSMAGRHPKLFSNPIIKKIYKTEFGKKLLFLFFGRKNKKSSWPEWVARTDEERCLPGQSKILTDQGLIQINKIVNNRLPVKVASLGKNGNIEYKKIIDYQKFNNETPMVTITYPYAPDCKRTNAICCTENHKIYTKRGYVMAKDIKNTDLVYMPVKAYNTEVIQVIYGMLLGDSHIYNDKHSNGMLRVVSTNGEKQLDYLKYKYNIFNDGKIVNAGIGSLGKEPSYHWFLNTDAQISTNIRKDWYEGNKKVVTDEVCDKITAVSLAFWYMDDGNLTYRNLEKTAYWIRLNTQGFSYEENLKLTHMLKTKFNVESKVNKDKTAKDGHQLYRIDISSTKESDIFLNLVSNYICDSMLYKLPPSMQDRKLTQLSYKKQLIVLPIPVLKIESGQKKNKIWPKTFNTVYDIEVEDNHNFVADNIVVHNCQNMPWILADKSPWIVTEKIDGISTTFTMKRKPFGRYDFYVCSRNVVFDKPDKECFYDTNVYTEMAEKYHVEEFLKNYLKENPKVEWVTLQGETYGQGIQKRDYSLKEHNFVGFNFVTSTEHRWNSISAAKYCSEHGISWVPILDGHFILPDTVEEMLEYATDNSIIDGGMREGVVLRDLEGKKSFKAVSNEYLLKYHS